MLERIGSQAKASASLTLKRELSEFAKSAYQAAIQKNDKLPNLNSTFVQDAYKTAETIADSFTKFPDSEFAASAYKSAFVTQTNPTYRKLPPEHILANQDYFESLASKLDKNLSPAQKEDRKAFYQYLADTPTPKRQPAPAFSYRHRKNPGISSPTHLRQASPDTLFSKPFTQGSHNTCYLLSLIHALKTHPKKDMLLKHFKIQEAGSKYRVIFPGQEHFIEVSKQELQNYQGVQSPDIRIRALEAAFLKHTNRNGSEFAESAETLGQIMPPGSVDTISLQRGRQQTDIPSQFIAGADFPHHERTAQFKAYLTALKAASQQDTNSLDILTAFKDSHYYGLDPFSGGENHVYLIDPYHPDTKTMVTIDELLHNYDIEGGRVDL